MTPLTVLFISLGDTCRSPMAAVVAEAMARREGLGDVTFTSAGITGRRIGQGIDPRAAAALQAAGYQPGPHRARQVGADELRGASMVIGMQSVELRKAAELAPQARPLYLLTDFDRNASPGTGIENPTYGDQSSFVAALSQIEAAMPQVLKRIHELRRR